MGFFATFWTWLNGQLATYIGANTARLAAVLEPAVVTLATVYVMVWGYLHLTGRMEEPVVAGLKRLGWNEAVLKQKRKGDGGKVALAKALRAGTTMPLTWIAGRLAMGSRGYLAWL